MHGDARRPGSKGIGWVAKTNTENVARASAAKLIANDPTGGCAHWAVTGSNGHTMAVAGSEAGSTSADTTTVPSVPALTADRAKAAPPFWSSGTVTVPSPEAVAESATMSHPDLLAARPRLRRSLKSRKLSVPSPKSPVYGDRGG